MSMNLFLFDKDLRDSTMNFISFGHIWEDNAEHKLISKYLLFNKIPAFTITTYYQGDTIDA